MSVRVMLVDDSTVVRGLITRSLSKAADIEIVATASNGLLALPLALEHRPDVIILDVEMPEMDGITALPKLLELSPKSKIIMASSFTVKGAEITLQALKLGAIDYITKPTTSSDSDSQIFYQQLYSKITELAPITKAVISKPFSTKALLSPAKHEIKALAIASSTGGPQALVTLFEGLRGKLNGIPIFLTQHMPPLFTAMLANNIANTCSRQCVEAKDGDQVKPGITYVAPGDYHMLAAKQGFNTVIKLNQNPQVNFCRPSADPMIESLSELYGKNLMVLVLTGMGQDGLEGAKIAVKAGGTIIAQDEETSVVWGMPKAVATNNLCSMVLPLPEISQYLIRSIGG